MENIWEKKIICISLENTLLMIALNLQLFLSYGHYNTRSVIHIIKKKIKTNLLIYSNLVLLSNELYPDLPLHLWKDIPHMMLLPWNSSLALQCVKASLVGLLEKSLSTNLLSF